MRKITRGTVIGAVVLIPTFLIHSRVEEERRQASYHSALASFQRDLLIGTEKAAVQQYLRSRRVDYQEVRYGDDIDTYKITIDEKPSNLICKDWRVYVALEFTAPDRLREIHLMESGRCL